MWEGSGFTRTLFLEEVGKVGAASPGLLESLALEKIGTTELSGGEILSPDRVSHVEPLWPGRASERLDAEDIVVFRHVGVGTILTCTLPLLEAVAEAFPPLLPGPH